MKNLSQNQSLQKSINDINRLEDKSLHQIVIEEKHQDLLSELLNFQNDLDHPLDLENLYILGMDGKIYFSLDEDIDQNELLPIYKSILGGKTYSIKFVPFGMPNNGNAFVTMPIYVSEDNLNSEPMGMIIAKLDLLELDNVLRRSFQFSNSDESFLVNEDNQIILKSGNKENTSSEISLNTMPITTCFDERRNYYGKYLNSDNGNVYGFSYCITDLNLALLTEINESEVLNPIVNLQQIFLFIGIILFVGIGSVSFFLSKSISRPILKLKNSADSITDGNFSVRSNTKSDDEIEQLSKSFDVMASKIQDSLEKIKQRDQVIQEQQDLLLEFSENKQKCCVGIIDIVNSTKITANLSDKDTSNFYGIFINFMASIVTDFEGVVIKNIGDALLFYFPENSKNDKKYFENVLGCCMMMINSHNKLNDKMDKKNPSSLSYRISVVYGPIMIAQMSTSSVVDIFGSTVNICTKINSLANPNEFVIEEDLYDIVKSYDKFKLKHTSFVNNNVTFKAYSVNNKYSNKNTNLSYLHNLN